jgi:hypothetical protein
MSLLQVKNLQLLTLATHAISNEIEIPVGVHGFVISIIVCVVAQGRFPL